MADTFAEALRECMEALGGVRSKSEIASWVRQKYGARWKPATLDGHLYGCCVNNPKAYEHHPSFPRFLFAHGHGRYELYDPARHGQYENGFPAGERTSVEFSENASTSELPSEEGGSGFAYEAHLRDYLAKHLDLLEPGLALWSSIEESVEYALNGRRVDILAKDGPGRPVIIELKVSRGHERTLGQCLLYRAKLKETLKVSAVRIFIVAEEIGDELRAAARELPDVTLYEYSLSMTVRRV